MVQMADGELQEILAADSVAAASWVEVNETNDLALISIPVNGDPTNQQSIDLIERIRNEYVPGAFEGVPAQVHVTGLGAKNLDFTQTADRLRPYVFAFVLGLSFLLLMVAFRSLLVPHKAVLMNLLSVGASYGLMVLVFQWGWGNEVLGLTKVEVIDSWIPVFLFAVLFGLSMDYHVFLLSRIREEFARTGNNAESVVHGIRTTGKIITGAALIMVAVFAGVASGDMVFLQQFGFGLAVAILLDATIVRLVLVPSAMRLLGAGNWYLPKALHWLPKIQVEG